MSSSGLKFLTAPRKLEGSLRYTFTRRCFGFIATPKFDCDGGTCLVAEEIVAFF
jgi:hypothetical protein